MIFDGGIVQWTIITYDSGDVIDMDYTYEDGNLEIIMRSKTGNTWTLKHRN